MATFSRRLSPAVVALLATASALNAADNPERAFAKRWQGRRVVLKQILYTLVYNERGRLGTTRNGRRDGLTVITPPRTVYFQFDGRQGKDDVIQQSPQRMMDAVDAVYQPDTLELRPYRRVEPLSLDRFAVGFELVVSKVRIDRDSVRLLLAAADARDDDDPVTWITVKWPAPFSKSFSESQTVDMLIRELVEARPTS